MTLRPARPGRNIRSEVGDALLRFTGNRLPAMRSRDRQQCVASHGPHPQLRRGDRRVWLIRVAAVALVLSPAVSCVDHRDPWPERPDRAPLGCGEASPDFHVAQRLAVVGDAPWCSASRTSAEAYRLIWGHRATPTVITLVPAGDSAVLRVVGVGHIDARGRSQRTIDTTLALSRQAWESYRLVFNDAARRARIVPPPSGDAREPSLWMVEGQRYGAYRAMVAWSGMHVPAAHVNAFYWLAKPAGLWSRFTGVY
jgi:hypothetical protein